MVPAERKRPWYLVLALLAALAIGMASAVHGWHTVVLYQSPIDSSLAGAGIADEADRLAVIARFEAYLSAMDMAKPRVWPLSVAGLVLGVAIFVAAMRTLGGSGGARAVLVQLVFVQAGVNALNFWLLRDVLDAELRLVEAKEAAEVRERIPQADQARVLRDATKMGRALYPAGLALDTLGSALVVAALTRRRSREFFDPARPALREP
jgi:hypothetical protein